MDAKLKHLEFIQGVISRMATNQFLFKGWAITIASALAAFAAVNTKWGLLTIAIVSTLLFWGLDGYYLWLECGFRDLYSKVADIKEDSKVDFSMAVSKDHAFCRWIAKCFRPHLWVFYLSIAAIEVVGIFVIRSVHHG